MTPRL
ncbi:hypothetical protein BsWGS_12718 [Bradybaena similaris]